MRRRTQAVLFASLLGAAFITNASAQTRSLLAGGSRSLFATTTLEAGDEAFSVDLRSGGNLDVRSMRLGSACVGFAMARPDVIVRSVDSPPRLDLSVRANGGDTTLIVHTPDGRWLCNDDGGGGTNPRLRIESPASGQYDIWVGSYRADQHLRATFEISAGD